MLENIDFIVRIYHQTEKIPEIIFPVVTIGTFDGVHTGHRKIIHRLVELAQSKKGQSVLITFFPHPRFVLSDSRADLQLLNTTEEKYKLIEKLGVDHLIEIPFTKEFAGTSFEDFISDFLVDKIHVKKLVIGQNHHLGHERKGDFENLIKLGNQFGFEVEKVDMIEMNTETVSSSKIRKALMAGNIKVANAMLGYEYSISGKVIYGNKLGRTIGFPTANIETNNKNKLVPADGAYAVKVLWNNQEFHGMLNSGIRPTLDMHKHTTEVNIFDFDKDIYYDIITIFFADRIRDEMKFDNLDSLKTQLTSDRQEAEKILNQKIISSVK
jgi:riboflavin kinase / FMN adenylyltransferase